MKSIFPESMLSYSGGELTLEGIATKLTTFTEQFWTIHWNTSSYAEHMATGSMYDYIHDFKDGIMEKLMGYTGRKPSPHKMEPLMNTSATSVAMEVMNFASQLKSYGEANGYHDVCNLADSLSGEAAKLRYLLTLS